MGAMAMVRGMVRGVCGMACRGDGGGRRRRGAEEERRRRGEERRGINI